MQEHNRPCWVEVDLEAVERNYLEAVRRAGPGRKVIASIKGNAYGHGVKEVAKALDRQNAFAFWTGHVDEAVALRHEGVTTKIIMFGGYVPSAISLLISEGLIPTIYDIEGAQAAAAWGKGKAVPIYAKVDAGLGRLGTPLSEAEQFILALAKNSALLIEGIYTHLPFRDLAGKKWALRGYERFVEVLDRLKQQGIEPEMTQLWAS